VHEIGLVPRKNEACWWEQGISGEILKIPE
jgi:hypothetical protein